MKNNFKHKNIAKRKRVAKKTILFFKLQHPFFYLLFL